MIQTLFPFLPSQLTGLGFIAVLLGAAIGVGFWLVGSKFSRGLVALLSVSLGMFVGLQLPQWFDWGIHGWATGTLIAIVFGVSGYAWHKIWIGTCLGLVLAVWAAVTTFAAYGLGGAVSEQGGIDIVGQWIVPALAEGANSKAWFMAFWNSLGENVRKVMPFACLAGLLSGMSAAAVWPRFGTVMLYSMLGVTMFVGLGVTAVVGTGHVDWLAPVPRTMTSQMVVLLALVAFGAIFQWRVAPESLAEDRPYKEEEPRQHN